jgi:hypothetical protein
MNLSIIFLVFILQIVTIYLDNKTNMFDFFYRVQKGTVASAYTKRGITLTISRTLFFAVPPLLGFLILNSNKNQIEYLMLAIVFINFLITFVQGYLYCKNFDKNIFTEIRTMKSIYMTWSFFIGTLAFMFFLITPYLLNYFAIIFPEQGLWIVQLNAVFNSFLTLYVIWIFEPRVAKKIDKKNPFNEDFFEAIMVRITGRGIIIIFIFLLISFYP